MKVWRKTLLSLTQKNEDKNLLLQRLYFWGDQSSQKLVLSHWSLSYLQSGLETNCLDYRSVFKSFEKAKFKSAMKKMKEKGLRPNVGDSCLDK